MKWISAKQYLLAIAFSVSSLSTVGCSSTVKETSSSTDINSLVPLNFLPALAGDYFKLESESVGRPFHIYVRLPEGYDENKSKQYPVVYLLDGDSLFPILATNHLFLQYDDKLPEAIIVGIAYGSFDPSINKRGYDFSAPAVDAKPNQGGAPKFQQFLETELIPDIESRYQTDPNKRVLFGQSRGGYMVLYSAFTKPDLFWGHIASNPSIKPGRERFFSTPNSANRDDLSLILTSGSHDRGYSRDNAMDWSKEWQNRNDAPWDVKVFTIDGGTHAANSTDSYRLGINWLFHKEDTARDSAAIESN
ncbi:alpha/beta hydrolase [Shewanella woodyi]|uniref:Putative esterase n=1 Tax=Shewanella woodyi (strain ATCC 51908 / MS32) TaxID=392500 RepID=B1KDJ0_SHEWM|nr:alpha/beta hydrolase-fold protein [Shewanella woodyi]ACA84991.1 putative esterase [Shewanella woodyi ATCC 51908]